MRRREKLDPNKLEVTRGRIAFNSGLLAIPVISIVELLTAPERKFENFDLPLRIGVYFFAVSIPVLAISIAAGIDQLHREYTVKIKEVLPWMFVANVIGVVAATLGTACLFFHFSMRVGIVFVAAGVICTGGWGIYINLLNDANVEATEQESLRQREEGGDFPQPVRSLENKAMSTQQGRTDARKSRRLRGARRK